MTKSQADPFKYFRIEAVELIDKLTRGLLTLEKKGFQVETVDELNRAAHSMKGAARLVELFEAGDLAHEMEAKLAELKEAKKTRKKDITNLLKQVDQIEKSIRGVLEGPTPAASDATAAVSVREAARAKPDAEPAATSIQTTTKAPPVDAGIAWVSTRILDRIGHCAGLVVELGNRARDWERKLDELRAAFRAVARQLDSTQSDAGPREIDTSLLSGLADSIVGEVKRGLAGIPPLGQRLYGLTLEARVGSVEEVSHRFEKTVRDTAWELGRLANLVIRGREILIDRLALQRLTEPVCHLLRNAVAHGIESPADRRERSKPEEGIIQLRFERSEDHIRVTVEDDGRGLDVELIRKAAGLRKAPGGNPDASDISTMIFQPGLSTQAQPTKIAGRGLGLDVVRNAVEELGGTVKVQSEPGRFCRFVMEVPANLDVMDVFVVSVGKQNLVIPTSRVASTRIISAEDIFNIAGKDTLLVDSFPVPLLSLAGLLDAPCDLEDAAKYRILIIRCGAQRFALAVDNLRGKQRVAVKSLPPDFDSCRILAGHASLNDGSSAFLLHVDALAEQARGGSFAVRAKAKPKPNTRRSVLVVDDSLTSRMNEKAILEAAGYCVHVAKDGPEALSLLPHVRCDLIILDYEMPQLNGLQVAERVRQIPDYASVPMIMVSSVDSAELKARSLAAGLKAYLTKGDFDQAVFLDTVQESIEALEKQP